MLCLNFARKAIKSKKYKNWFEVQTQIGIETRSEKNILKPVTLAPEQEILKNHPFHT